jgi:hypothetical protein
MGGAFTLNFVPQRANWKAFKWILHPNLWRMQGDVCVVTLIVARLQHWRSLELCSRWHHIDDLPHVLAPSQQLPERGLAGGIEVAMSDTACRRGRFVCGIGRCSMGRNRSVLSIG